MKLITNRINVGAVKPFSLLHISDTHLTLADGRDDDRKLRLAATRTKVFEGKTGSLSEAAELANKLDALIVHTGDMIDFVSEANLDAAKKFTDENDCFMAAGNHEFSLYVGEAKEDAAYRDQSLDRVQAAFKNDIRFSSRVVNGVNLVAVDNSYYLFERWQLDALKAEVKKGLPVILMMHTPLYSEHTLELMHRHYGKPPYYLMAVPEEEMTDYPPQRAEQQRADADTLAAYEYIVDEPMIKAILAGHVHEDNEAKVNHRLTQYITGLGSARHITIE